jgi:hypothetical protein
MGIAPEIPDTLTSRLVVFNGDQGSAAAALHRFMISLPEQDSGLRQRLV